MSWLIWILFESIAVLSAVCGVTLFVLLVYWRRSGRGRPLLISLAITVVLLVVQALVVTRREHAGRILEKIEKDLVASKTDALAAALAADFDAGESRGRKLDRDGFLTFARDQLELIDVRWLDRWQLRVEQTEAEETQTGVANADRFTVSATYKGEIVIRSGSVSPFSAWVVTFVRTPDGWKIAHIHCRHIDGVRSPSWQAINRRR